MKKRHSIGNLRQKRVKLTIMSGFALLSISIMLIMVLGKIPLQGTFSQTIDRNVFIFGMTGGFLALLTVPLILEKAFKLNIPLALFVIYYLTCLGGAFLGNVANMYYAFGAFDDIVHVILGMNASMTGLALYMFFGEYKDDTGNPKIMLLFTALAGIAFGALWEVVEFIADILFNLNMQDYIMQSGEFFVGQAAIRNTMVDIIVNMVGVALVVTLAGISLKTKKNWHRYCKITRIR